MIFKRKEPPIIISVGGSLIVPNGGVDTEFLSKFNKLIRSQVIKGRRFMLVAGGGRIARHYRDAGKTVIGNISDEDLDWLAIHTTRLNGHLLRTIFQDIANPRIIINYEKKIANWKEPIAIGAGWKPGWSTDYDAVILARDYKASVVINLSNIDGIYDSDPNINKEAKLIKKITWNELEKLVGKKWSPGLNMPFDPIATQLAKKIQATVIVASGSDLQNLENIIEGEAFKGTVIMPFKIDSSYYDRDYYAGLKGGHRLNRVDSLFGIFIQNIVSCVRAFFTKIWFNPKNCLDVGCGPGFYIKWLRFFGIDAYGLDLSPTAKELADPKVKEFIKVGDVTEIPFKDNQFEYVMSVNLLQRLDHAKIKKAISETIRVSSKYIHHKVHTRDNILYDFLHKQDFSEISLFYKSFWEKIFSSLLNVKVIKKTPFLNFLSFETRFLLKKKQNKK